MKVGQSARFDPTMLITRRFPLAEIKQGHELFGQRSGGMLKVLTKLYAALPGGTTALTFSSDRPPSKFTNESSP